LITLPAWIQYANGQDLDLTSLLTGQILATLLIWDSWVLIVLSIIALQYLSPVDRHGVLLSIDQRGIYFGGLGNRYTWEQIAHVVLFNHPRDDGQYWCGHVTLVLKRDSMGRLDTENPFQWGPSQRMLLTWRTADKEKARIREAVRRHAVAVELLDLGELKLRRCRARLKAARRANPRFAPNSDNSHWWSRRAPAE
jgi:hypothetical protein